ncbi:hypothetical protein MCEMAEM4_03383 [Burkholderiaceae bacterium]
MSDILTTACCVTPEAANWLADEPLRVTMPTLSTPTASMVKLSFMLSEVSVNLALAAVGVTAMVAPSPRTIWAVKSASTESQVCATVTVSTAAVATVPASTSDSKADMMVDTVLPAKAV